MNKDHTKFTVQAFRICSICPQPALFTAYKRYVVGRVAESV